MHTAVREKRRMRPAFYALALFALMTLTGTARAQWSAPDASGNINSTNTGNVGVGTGASAPAAKLDIKGGTADATAPALTIRNSSDSSLFFVRNDGRVGIGTTSPAVAFHLSTGTTRAEVNIQTSHASGPIIRFRQDAGAAADRPLGAVNFLNDAGTSLTQMFAAYPGTDNTKSYFRLTTSGAEALRIDSTGQVGIGTTAPSFKLDVAGQVRSSSGGFVFPDGTSQATALSFGAAAGKAVQGDTTLTVAAGTGMSGGGTATLGGGGTLTLTNSDPGSSQNIFKNVGNAAGATQFSAGSNGDTLRFEGTGSASVSFDPANRKVVINAPTALSSGWTDTGSSVSLTSSTANVGIGTASPQSRLHLGGANGETLTFDTPGAAKGRVMAIPNVANWLGTTLNASYNGAAWNLDATANDGWFYKLDARLAGGTAVDGNGMWLYRVPAGPNPRTNVEYPVFGATADRVAVGRLTIDYAPSSTLDVRSAGSSASTSGLSVINGSGATNLFVRDDGNVGVGTASPSAKLDVNGSLSVGGDINASGNIAAKYQDVAEWVPSTQRLAAGTVVVLDTERTNHVLASSKAYDTGVAGVVSDSPGVILGVGGEGRLKVATTGRVRVRVDATRGAIHVGDLLVTGEAEGVAMKSVPVELGGVKIHRPGTIIGKALEPLATGTGEILVLLSLQ